MNIKIIYKEKINNINDLLNKSNKLKEIKMSQFLNWLEETNNESNNDYIEKYLISNNYIIIDDVRDHYKDIDLSFLNDFDNDSLDDVLDSEDFQQEVKNLKVKIDKAYNREYLINLHSNDDYDEKNISLSNLVEANKKLVWKNVMYFQKLSTSTFDIEDMYQAGMFGLMKAAEKFDINKEYKFSTYATWWIRQRIMRSIDDYSTTIRIPST